jgi:hypothetical protein
LLSPTPHQPPTAADSLARLDGVLASFVAGKFELGTMIWVLSPSLNLISNFDLFLLFFLIKSYFGRPIWGTPLWAAGPKIAIVFAGAGGMLLVLLYQNFAVWPKSRLGRQQFLYISEMQVSFPYSLQKQQPDASSK